MNKHKFGVGDENLFRVVASGLKKWLQLVPFDEEYRAGYLSAQHEFYHLEVDRYLRRLVMTLYADRRDGMAHCVERQFERMNVAADEFQRLALVVSPLVGDCWQADRRWFRGALQNPPNEEWGPEVQQCLEQREVVWGHYLDCLEMLNNAQQGLSSVGEAVEELKPLPRPRKGSKTDAIIQLSNEGLERNDIAFRLKVSVATVDTSRARYRHLWKSSQLPADE